MISVYLCFMRGSFVVLIVCFLFAHALRAQQDSILPKISTRKAVVCEIKMKNSSVYTGYIQQQTDSVIFLKTEGGVLLEIPKHNVRDIFYVKSHPIGDTSNAHMQYPPDIADKYYVAVSNAFLFKRKQFYGSSNNLIFYNLNYSFNDHFSLGISTSPIFIPVLLHVKLNFEVARKLYIGIDGMGGSGSWISYKSFGGGGLVKLTYGGFKKNATVFAGYGDVNYYGLHLPFGRGGYRNSNGYRGGGGSGGGYRPPRKGGGFGSGNFDHIYTSAIAGAAVCMPLSAKIYFVAEVFAFPEIGAYSFCPAIRTVARKRVSWVFGLEASYQANIGSNEFGLFSHPLLPYIGFSFKI